MSLQDKENGTESAISQAFTKLFLQIILHFLHIQKATLSEKHKMRDLTFGNLTNAKFLNVIYCKLYLQ